MPALVPDDELGPGRIGSGVFVTGELGLQPGVRYTIHIDGRRLLIRQPSQGRSSVVASQRQLRMLDANRVGDRLVITTIGSRGPRTLMVFMSLSAPGAEGVAAAIHDAAAEQRGDGA
jgi:hypothetical protein